METSHRCTVSKIMSTLQFNLFIPKEETRGSKFGTCTCGKPAKDGVLCKHMVAIVKASKIDGLTRIKSMPY